MQLKNNYNYNYKTFKRHLQNVILMEIDIFYNFVY